MKTLEQRLIDIEAMADNAKTIETHTWHKTHLSRFDVRRKLNQQPAWLSQTTADSTQQKKIILDYYHLLFAPTKNDVELIHFLLQKNFQLFIPIQSGKLEEIKSSTELAVKLPLIEVLPKGLVEDDLSHDKKEAKHYLVVDHTVRLRLLNELKPYLNLEDYPDNRYELTLTPERCNALDEHKIKALCLIASEGGFNSISCNINYLDVQYQLTWGNSLSPPQFEQLLLILKEGDVEKLFTPQFNSKLQELTIKDETTHIINVSSFSALKKLNLKLTKRPNSIIGIEKLTDLEELNLAFNFNDQRSADIIINLRELKKLSKLSVDKNGCNCGTSCSYVVLNGLEQCSALSELSISHNRVKIADKAFALDGSLFSGLRSLILNNSFLDLNNAAAFTQLESLSLIHSNIPDSFPPNLRRLTIEGLSTKSIGLSLLKGLAQLEELYLKGSGPSSIDLDYFPQLRTLHLEDCHLSELNMGAAPLLEDLRLEQLNQLKTVNLSALKQLNTLYVSEINVQGLESCNQLTQLSISGSELREIELANHENLVSLTVKNCDELEIVRSLTDSKLEFIVLNNCDNLIVSEKDIPAHAHSASLDNDDSREFTKHSVIKCDPILYSSKNATNSSPDTKSHFSSAVPICFEESKERGDRLSLYKTYTAKKVKHFLRQFYPINEGDPVPPTQHNRDIVYDQIILDDKNRIQLKKIEETAAAYNIKPSKNHEKIGSLYIGIEKLFADFSGSYFILSGLSSQDELIDISHRESWEIRYSTCGQYMVKWIGDNNQFPPCVHYVLQQNSQYFYDAIPITTLYHSRNTLHNLLPFQIKDIISNCLDTNPTPFFKELKAATTKQQRFNLIVDFCRRFKNEALSLPDNAENDKDFINAYNLILREGKGSSYHRALAYLALCHYYSIPARVAESQDRYFAEITISSSGGEQWIALDLGDTIQHIVEKPNPYRDTRMENKPRAKHVQSQAKGKPDVDSDEDIDDKVEEYDGNELENQTAVLPDLAALSLDSPFKSLASKEKQSLYQPSYFNAPPLNPDEQAIARWKARYKQHNAWLQACPDIPFFICKLIMQNSPVLLRVPQKEDAWRWDMLIRQQVNADIPVVFIDFDYELTSFLELLQIKDSDQTLVDGPLKKLLKQQHGIIIINWSNFSVSARGTYKCIMDRPRTLHGDLLPPDVKIIGILAQHIEVNDVFLSRCNEIYLPAHLRRPQQGLYAARDWFKEQGEMPPESKLIDLYNSVEWPKFLLEDLVLNGNQIKTKAGPLVSAVKKGRDLVLQNPPLHDVSFRQLLHRLTTENVLYYNGEAIPIHHKFSLTLQKKTPAATTPNKVIFDSQASTNKGKKYHLSTENYYQLFDLQHIGDDELIYTLEGILSTYRDGDQFIVESRLSKDQWQRLFDTIESMDQSAIPDFHFYVDPKLNETKANTKAAEVPPSSVETLIAVSKELRKSTWIESKDPSFIADEVAKSLDLKPTQFFYLTNENSWSNLIEQVDIIQGKNSIRGKRKDSAFWQQLKAGQTLILCGNLTAQDYMSLKTLFCDAPYLYVNGKREDIKGKVIWVSPANAKLPLLVHPDFVVQPNLLDYKKTYTNSNANALSADQLERLDSFVGIMETQLSPYPFTYEKYRACAEALKENRSQENPLKPILNYHYKKQDKKYFFLSALAKVYFSKGEGNQVSREKLQTLLDQIHSEQDLRISFWQLANCFSGEVLRKSFTHLDLQLSPSTKLQQTLLSTLNNYGFVLPSSLLTLISDVNSNNSPGELTAKKCHPSRLQKQIDTLTLVSKQPDKPVIYLLGETVTGKSEAAEQVAKANGDFHYGEKKIIAWLNSKPSGTRNSTLLLENINLSKPGKWEFLNGIAKGVVQYEGETYPLLPGHKLIVTCNPLHYSGRHFQPLLWNIAYVIWFQSFQTHFMQQQIQNQFVGTFDEPKEVADTMMLAFNYLVNSKQCEPPVTLRDMINCCWRVKSMDLKLSWKQNVAKALFDEMAYLCVTKESRKEYKKFLQETISVWGDYYPKHVPKDRELVITKEKYEVWGLIETTFLMRDQRIKAGTNLQGKLGTFLIGPSSVGKSTCWRKAAELRGFSRDAIDSQSRYYQFTAGCNPDEIEVAKTLLLEAFDGGSFVIYDELNLNPELEDLLVHLLDGKTPEGREANKPGFTVLTSGNPPRYAGCKLLSDSLACLLHKIEVDDFTVNELIYIAMTLKHPDAKNMTLAFDEVRRQEPALRLNARNFFTMMNQTLPPESSTYNHELEEGSSLSKK